MLLFGQRKWLGENDRLRVGLWIVNRDLDVHVAEIVTTEAFDDVQRIAMQVGRCDRANSCW